WDKVYSLNRLQTIEVYDPDKDNTGMHIVSTDPVAIAWGESPRTAGTGTPFLDMGYTTLPLPTEWIDIALEVEKTANPTQVKINEETTFTIIIRVPATAGSPVTNIDLVDKLPIGWEYVAGSGTPFPPSITGSLSSGYTLTWDGNWNLNPGQSQTVSFKAKATSSVDTGSPNRNIATATGESLGAPLTADDDAFVDIIAELGITKLGPTEAMVGTTITYTGTLTNYQGGTAYDVVLVDQLPTGLSFVSSSHSAVYDPVANTVTWNLGNLAPGASIPGWLTVKIDAGLADNTKLTDTFSVKWKDRFGNSYGPATASWDTIVYTRPELVIEKTGPSEARPGDTISYNIKVTNIGGMAAFDVVIMDILPAGFIYSSSDPSGTHFNGMVTWSVGTIPAYGVKEVSVTFKVDKNIVENVVLVNTATVTWKDSLGLECGPKGAAKEVAIYTLPQLEIEKTGPSVTCPGKTFTYTLVIKNIGGTAATNVKLTDTLPAELIYVSSNRSGTESPQVQ
ncbi:MAG: hypothetical protein QXL25_03265, partial [Candidatus Bathyarchaeia archaeon]